MQMSDWATMNARRRLAVPDLTRTDLPKAPGVYAFYRDGKAVYVGKATMPRDRVWKRHCGGGKSMRSSAFRRNVAQHLGIASADDIYRGRYRPSTIDLERVRAWIEECELAWMATESEPDAVALEAALKSEAMPPLTRLSDHLEQARGSAGAPETPRSGGPPSPPFPGAAPYIEALVA